MSLDEQLILQRTPRLSVEFRDHGIMYLHTPGRSLMCGPHGLAVIDAFTHPISVKDAMARLKGRSTGIQDWLDLIGTIESLHKEGVLVPPSGAETGEASPLSPDVVAFHQVMLDDRDRTSRFIEAIEATVRPGDVVVDLGTGTGILAMAAARAGAERVYAIEAGKITTAAQALFEANGLTDTITLVTGWSTQVTLPQRADVLVSETIGAQPLSERVLEMTWDARQRYLKPDARMVPNRIRILAVPVPRPELADAGRIFAPQDVEKWAEWYGFDFSALVQPVADDLVFLELPSSDVQALGALGPPVVLGEIDLMEEPELVFDRTATTTVDIEGTVGGVAIFFELDLGPGIDLTNHPARADARSHWPIPVAILPDAIAVSPGDTLEIRYRYAGMTVDVWCGKSMAS